VDTNSQRPSNDATGGNTITRRSLLGGTLAGAVALAGASVPSRAAAAKRVDVVVVGAGFAGLSAAVRIAHAGRSVLVLEARNRVGGRVVNRPIGGGKVLEAGGQFVGPTQDRILALARRYGVRTYHAFDQGKIVTIFGGRRFVGGYPPPLDDEYAMLATRLQALADQVPVAAPWEAARAQEWDRQTLQTWIDANAETPEGAAVFATLGRLLWGAEAHEVSLLYALSYIAGAGNKTMPGTLRRLLAVDNGAQERRFFGGSALIAERIAAELGTRVVLSTPVREILQGSGVRHIVVKADGIAVEAKRVIVAVPPQLAAEIHYEPGLPGRHRELLRRRPMGAVMKPQAIYAEPFWRRDGLSGESLKEGGPVSLTLDNTPQPGRTPGVLLGFIGGGNARRWTSRPPAQLKKAILQNLVEVFGAQAAAPLDYFNSDWVKEEWTRGCPVAYAPPGVLTNYGIAAREPFRRIHWAGTETATFWQGYMDGAVRSGERAAREVLAALV
jgi:monoamine oxidase